MEGSSPSQERPAEMCRMRPTYGGVIEGERSVTIGNVDRIARALGITLADLFEMLEHGAGRPGGG